LTRTSTVTLGTDLELEERSFLECDLILRCGALVHRSVLVRVRHGLNQLIDDARYRFEQLSAELILRIPVESSNTSLDIAVNGFRSRRHWALRILRLFTGEEATEWIAST
jgi:hypothetical protein